jgi:hypothetical protein
MIITCNKFNKTQYIVSNFYKILKRITAKNEGEKDE